MNKKKAGEDFYFLEKIAKQHTIYTLNSTKVFPSIRGSWRVPFGTGQRVNRYLAKEQNEYLVYHPESFECLKKWLVILKNNSRTYSEIEQEAQIISPNILTFLVEQKFQKFWENACLLPEKQFLKAVRIWFDGFKTLKFLHHLRDTEYSFQPMFIAIPSLAGNYDKSLLKFQSQAVPVRNVQVELLNAIRKLSADIALHKY